MKTEPGYEKLAEVLQDALDQAQHGKGKERHAAGEPYDQQEICQNTLAVGLGYPLGQARKKAREAKRLLRDRGKDAAIAECLGAINYLAAAVIVMDGQDRGGKTEELTMEKFNKILQETYNKDKKLVKRWSDDELKDWIEKIKKEILSHRPEQDDPDIDYTTGLMKCTAQHDVEDTIRWRQGDIPDHTCTKEEDEAQMMAVRQAWESKAPSDVPTGG